MSRVLVDSGIGYIGKIPDSWNVYRIKNAFKCNKRIVNDEWSNTQLLSLTTAGVKEKDIENPNGKLPESFEGYQFVDKNNLIMCLFDLDCSAVFSGISKYSGMISPAYKVLECKDKMYPGYAGYYFNYIGFDRKYMHYSKNIRYTLNYDEFSSLPMVFPSLSDQKKIANYLDKQCSKIDEIIKDNNNEIELLEEYQSNIIIDTIKNGFKSNKEKKDSQIEWVEKIPNNWSINKIKYVCRFNPSYKEKFENADIVGYVPMNLLKCGYAEPSEILLDKAPTGLTNFIDNDVIMAKVTPCFENGEIAVVNNLKNGIGLGSSELFVFNCDKILNKYLMYILNNKLIRNIFASTMTGTGGLKRVSPEYVKNFRIPYPPIDEQNKIIKYLDKQCLKIKQVIDYRKQIIEKLEEYKKSLIYECVTGKREV